MQLNVLWTGREFHSLENCLINITPAGADINSIIIGQHEGRMYRVDYHIKTNPEWETEFLHINSRHSNREMHVKFQSDGNGHWWVGDQKAPEFDGCFDVDIALTPCTNSLPVNRTKLPLHYSQEVRAIYFDLLNNETRPVNQLYKRISEFQYHYENIPNDFEADITVDEHGLIVDYPVLFSRSLVLPSSYCHYTETI